MATGDQVASGLHRLHIGAVSYSAFPRPPTAPKSGLDGSSHHHEHSLSPTALQPRSSLRPGIPPTQTSQLPPSPSYSNSPSPVHYSPYPHSEKSQASPRLDSNDVCIMYHQSIDESRGNPSQYRPTSQPRLLSSPRDSPRPSPVTETYRPQTSASSAPRRRLSNASSNASVPSPMHPPPTIPLPPIPPSHRTAHRVSSLDSYEQRTPTSLDFLRFSQASSSGRASLSDVASVDSRHSIHQHICTVPRPSEPEPLTRRTSAAQQSFASADSGSIISSDGVTLRPSRLLDGSAEKSSKKKNNTSAVYYLDLSSNGSTLATKHGNNIIRFWSVRDGTMHATIKFSSYTDAQSRSRDYLIRSHAILSEGSSLVAIAVKFGRTVDIWNWTARKCLQSLDGADRWTAGRFEFTENAWSQIALYHNDGDVLELYSAARGKKPFAKSRTIELNQAGLPFVPQYPELAISPTSPILVAASGPRPPRMGCPPPDQEVLLVAWEIGDSAPESHTPWRMNRPTNHPELETAIPSDLVTYGSTVASIWIPAAFRVVPNRRGDGFNLVSVPICHKIVLVWDLSTNTTRIYRIPNSTACVSPDCRFVAYCNVSGGLSARGNLTIIDLSTGSEVWNWPDKEAGEAINAMRRHGFEQLEHLNRITELSFSVDSKTLVVGDSEGKCGLYELREPGIDGDRMELYPM